MLKKNLQMLNVRLPKLLNKADKKAAEAVTAIEIVRITIDVQIAKAKMDIL